MTDSKEGPQDVSRKMKVGNVTARAKRKQQQALTGTTSVIPWQTLRKWTLLGLPTLCIVAIVAYYTYAVVTAPPPVDTAKCPILKEVAGKAFISLGGTKSAAVKGAPVLPTSRLTVGQSSTLRLVYPDGNVISLYSGSAATLPDDYSDAISITRGNAYAEVNAANPLTVNSPFGTATCNPGSVASIEVARSRCQVYVESGSALLTTTSATRQLTILAGQSGEVGTGAVKSGIVSSEADEDITYPGLEVVQVSMYDATKDHVLTAFDPMQDGAVYQLVQGDAPLLDFRILPNSSKTVYTEVLLSRVVNSTLEEVIKVRSEPVVAKSRIFPAFGATVTDNKVDYTGVSMPPGRYQLTVTPFAKDKTHGIGNGKSLTLRFSIDDRRAE